MLYTKDLSTPTIFSMDAHSHFTCRVTADVRRWGPAPGGGGGGGGGVASHLALGIEEELHLVVEAHDLAILAHQLARRLQDRRRVRLVTAYTRARPR